MTANIVEVDIYHLNGTYIERLPSRSRKTVRFQDRGNRLTRLIKKLEKLHEHERTCHYCSSIPGLYGLFHRWRYNHIIDKLLKFPTKLSKVTERSLRRELMSSREVTLLVREEHDKSVFMLMDRPTRNEIHEIFTTDQRLFDKDWVNLQVRIIDSANGQIMEAV